MITRDRRVNINEMFPKRVAEKKTEKKKGIKAERLVHETLSRTPT